jgi:hypothetical protein
MNKFAVLAVCVLVFFAVAESGVKGGDGRKGGGFGLGLKGGTKGSYFYSKLFFE